MSENRDWPPEDEQFPAAGDELAGDGVYDDEEEYLEETYEDRVAAPDLAPDAPLAAWNAEYAVEAELDAEAVAEIDAEAETEAEVEAEVEADADDEIDALVVAGAIPFAPDLLPSASYTGDEEVAGEPSELGEGERLRQPRAQSFRRRLANQVSMVPLALYLLAMGAYLIADKQKMDDLPDLTSPALIGGLVLAVAASMMLHSVVYGRRERGLLFVGLTVWVMAGAAGTLVSLEESPDAREWWPILLVALGISLLLTYLVERTHDARLVLLSVFTFTASGIAFWTTLGNADLNRLDNAADYWPLLLAVLAVGMLPLAFRRRTG
ncbi:hypothetical protein [Aggregatilinea lenta]|uniref:hypothetical protein n=1 Tax=Aggregatilinea lenta TaxID=913108 RepID=UPI000E5AA9E0|nr:hypothetical protein [Aggregatilinea lenta]